MKINPANQLYKINFAKFNCLLAINLTGKEIKQIKTIKETMLFDEYAGYSLNEQKKYQKIEKICGNKLIRYNEI